MFLFLIQQPFFCAINPTIFGGRLVSPVQTTANKEGDNVIGFQSLQCWRLCWSLSAAATDLGPTKSPISSSFKLAPPGQCLMT